MRDWPLRQLVLRTPRLELRPDDDDGLDELAEEARLGVHPPERMPFTVPWTDTDPRHLGRGTLQHFWRERGRLAPEDWAVHFLVRFQGHVVGVQSLGARSFAVTREVLTGSWIGMRRQGQGIGTEMRAAVLLLAFDHLGATTARSGAFVDNAASQRVSEKLGYRPDGTARWIRRGAPVEEVRLRVGATELVRPEWGLAVEGLDPCLDLLGAT